MKRIYDLDKLVIGEKYYVKSGIWSGNLIYCGHVHHPKMFTFCFGKCVDDWHDHFNIVDRKSNLKVFTQSYVEA